MEYVLSVWSNEQACCTKEAREGHVEVPNLRSQYRSSTLRREEDKKWDGFGEGKGKHVKLIVHFGTSLGYFTTITSLLPTSNSNMH